MIFDNTTIFDFETTGLDPEKNTLIELAAIRMVGGRQVGSFATTINPCIKIPSNITELTGITDNDVKNQPGIDIVIPYFMHFIGDSMLVAHNAAFDLSFLIAKVRELKLADDVINDFIDTRTLAIEYYPGQSHKLSVMCKMNNISLEGAHRALNDVKATGNLLYKFNKNFKTVPEFVNKLYYYKKYSIPKLVPRHSKMIGV